jgi:DNA mismatch repair protein MutS
MSATPMMAQYEAVKSQHPDCMVFFRLGDFYELFGEDAKEASRLLGITLTARSSGEGRSIKVPMAGVPHHAAPGYIQKLLKAGRKVAVCDQVGEAKKNMRRELVRIATPGTSVDESFLDQQSSNYLLAIFAGPKAWGMAAADNSTADFFAFSIKAGALDAFEAELERLKPRECLLPEGLHDEALESLLLSRRVLVSRCDPYLFSPEESARQLKAHFKVHSLESFGLREASEETQAAGALLTYLKSTQLSPLSHLRSLHTAPMAGRMLLDASALRNLELITNLEDGSSQGTLFWVLNHTRTAAGARLLKRWLTAPLDDLALIARRHDAVGAFLEEPNVSGAIQDCLSLTNDVERLVGRVGCHAANARDLRGLKATLEQVPVAQALLARLAGGSMQERLPRQDLKDLLDRLDALVDEPPLSIKEGGLFKSGVTPELDALIEDASGGKEAVALLQNRERARTGIESLKVQYNSIFGFYIEISRAQLGKAPSDYERKQTLVGAERFTLPELKALEERVLHADEKRQSMELEMFLELRQHVAEQSAALLNLASCLSELDVLLGFAQAAREGDYTRPKMEAGVCLHINEGRHPVVDSILRKNGQEPFVPNSLTLDGANGPQLLLITGPNMAGKSTYMRQAALLVLMAQSGSFLPAKSACIGLVDRIFTRVGASDRLQRGMSTFLVEMTECASILHNATPRSLVILDEIGRGTSTFDGIGIAYAVAEHLHESPQLRSRTLFATHYFELTELAERFERIQNASVAVKEWNGRIIFLHQVRPGSSEHSYGVAVARLAGLPEPVLQRAKEVLEGLENTRPTTFKPAQRPTAQASLFDAPALSPQECKTLSTLRELETDALTPLQALNLLNMLSKNLQEKPAQQA